MKENPYFIEVDTNGCSTCGHGRTWIVIGPDGYGGSASYEDEDDATSLADALNEAYWSGYSEGAATKGQEDGGAR